MPKKIIKLKGGRRIVIAVKPKQIEDVSESTATHPITGKKAGE